MKHVVDIHRRALDEHDRSRVSSERWLRVLEEEMQIQEPRTRENLSFP